MTRIVILQNTVYTKRRPTQVLLVSHLKFMKPIMIDFQHAAYKLEANSFG